MSITFRPAKRERTGLLIGIAGPSSAGKTFSALRLAGGLADGRPIYFIDTESGRALHYADQFQFEHGRLTAPFRPIAYLEAIQAAKQAGAGVIIVDSQSHSHEGPGGILEWHEEELDRMAGQDYAKRERVKFAAWIKPKAEHNHFVNTILQLGDTHVIFCFRAKDKMKLVPVTKPNGKTVQEPVHIGWTPICSDRFEYEMTALLMLPPGARGVPDLNAPSCKLQEQHRPIFRSGKQIDEEMGRALAQWAAGGSKPDQETSEPEDLEKAKYAANQGADFFRSWWTKRTKAQNAPLKPYLDELEGLCQIADTPTGGLPGDDLQELPEGLR